MAGELRITGGQLVRRRLAVPPAADRGALRPTSDKVRAAMMNALGARLHDARVLDVFSGSGALAIEAVSRGAAHATCIERDRRSAAVIEDNARALRRLPGGAFDVVLVDPPYATPVEGLFPELVRIVAAGGMVVLERDRRAVDVVPAPLAPTWERLYGDTRVVMYAVSAVAPVPVESPASHESAGSADSAASARPILPGREDAEAESMAAASTGARASDNDRTTTTPRTRGSGRRRQSRARSARRPA